MSQRQMIKNKCVSSHSTSQLQSINENLREEHITHVHFSWTDTLSNTKTGPDNYGEGRQDVNEGVREYAG